MMHTEGTWTHILVAVAAAVLSLEERKKRKKTPAEGALLLHMAVPLSLLGRKPLLRSARIYDYKAVHRRLYGVAPRTSFVVSLSHPTVLTAIAVPFAICLQSSRQSIQSFLVFAVSFFLVSRGKIVCGLYRVK
jgi:hypothetical protein